MKGSHYSISWQFLNLYSFATSFGQSWLHKDIEVDTFQGKDDEQLSLLSAQWRVSLVTIPAASKGITLIYTGKTNPLQNQQEPPIHHSAVWALLPIPESKDSTTFKF